MKKLITRFIVMVLAATISFTACGQENFSSLKDDVAKADYLGKFLDETENAKDEETMLSRLYNVSSYNEFEKTIYEDFKANAETTKKLKAAGFKISRRYGNFKQYDETTYVIASWTDISFNGEEMNGGAVYHYFVVNGDDVKYDLINSSLYSTEIPQVISHEPKEAPAKEVSFEENSKSFYGVAFGSTSEQVQYLMRQKGWTASSNSISGTVTYNWTLSFIKEKNAPDVKVIDFTGGKYLDEDDFIISFFFYKDSLFQVSVLKESNGRFNPWTEEYGYSGSKGEDVVNALKDKYNFFGNKTNKDGLDYSGTSCNRKDSVTTIYKNEGDFIIDLSIDYDVPPAYYFTLYDKKAKAEVINYYIDIVKQDKAKDAQKKEAETERLKNAL